MPSRFPSDLRRLARGWIAVLAGAYLLHVAAPMRLAPDAVVYLMQSAGGTLADLAPPRSYPPGYTALLGLLQALPLPMPAATVVVNVLGLGAGLWGAHALFRGAFGIGREGALWGVAVLMGSYGVIEQAVVAEPDLLVAGIGWLALALLVRAEGEARHRWGVWGCAVGLALLATSMRTAGGVLLLACGASALAFPSTRRGRVGAALGAGGVALGVGALSLPSLIGYAREWTAGVEQYGMGTLAWNVRKKLVDLTEMALNADLGLLGALLEVDVLRYALLVGVGGALVGAAIWGGWKRRREHPGALVFFAASLVLLLAWPGIGKRFLLPVWPLLLGYAWVALRPYVRRRPALRVVLVLWFVGTGAVAHGHALYTAFPPETSPQRYRSGAYAGAYEAFCGGRGVGPEREYRRYAWLVLREDQRPLWSALSPCPDGTPTIPVVRPPGAVPTP